MEEISRLSLHHVGYAVREIELASESYRARFDYRECTPIIHDRLQTAFVQFLVLPGDDVYLEFVAPDGPESRLSNAVIKGGGLNHLCYISDRLEDTIDKLVEMGMMLVSQPQPAVAFAGRRICWLVGDDVLPIELVERSHTGDRCQPGLSM